MRSDATLRGSADGRNAGLFGASLGVRLWRTESLVSKFPTLETLSSGESLLKGRHVHHGLAAGGNALGNLTAEMEVLQVTDLFNECLSEKDRFRLAAVRGKSFEAGIQRLVEAQGYSTVHESVCGDPSGVERTATERCSWAAYLPVLSRIRGITVLEDLPTGNYRRYRRVW